MRSLLETDGYKFSMAEAGWPLRIETFYFSHRYGGAQVLPVDIEKFIGQTLPVADTDGDDYNYLRKNEYAMGEGFQAAMEKPKIKVRSLPKMSIFNQREPVFSVTGCSAPTSWLEPLTLQLHFRIQVATLAVLDPAALAKEVAILTTPRQKEIVLETLDTMGVKAPPMSVREDEYRKSVYDRVRTLVEIVKDPTRIFEVGLRSASCMEQHMVALEACRDAGVKKTSNVYGARILGLTPVGTMGHEHLLRYGGDRAGFRGMRDRRKQRSSYLPDTYDTFLSGIPAALEVMAENPELHESIRYDSKDNRPYYLYMVAQAEERKLDPVHLFESGFNAKKTQDFENLRESTGVKMSHQHYGYGDWIVNNEAFGSLTRDRVAAVYKLCQTGPRAVMKFSDEQSKQSIPGRPVIFRRIGGPGREPWGIIGQEDERVPQGYFIPEGIPERPEARTLKALNESPASELSPVTMALRDDLVREARKQFA